MGENTQAVRVAEVAVLGLGLEELGRLAIGHHDHADLCSARERGGGG